MKLIADSGSTKTTWMEVETGSKCTTEGLNPHFTTDDQFLAACSAAMEKLGKGTGAAMQPSRLQTVFFYGAGCGQEEQRKRVAAILANGFGTSDIHVHTDMLGACRAVCGDRSGVVGILGTGSNVCYYDGGKIVHQPVSTGFILGDKGSANHVGRLLLNDYLTQRMPASLRTEFHKETPLADSQLLDAVYHRPAPNRFLASLAPFAVGRINEESGYCRRLIVSSLSEWLRETQEPLCTRIADEHPAVSFVGGFAKAIEPMLRAFMQDNGFSTGVVAADPIEGLRQYHLNIKKI